MNIYVGQNDISSNSLQDLACLQRESQTFSISRVVVQNFCQFTLFHLSVTEHELLKDRYYVLFFLLQVKLKEQTNRLL